MPDRNAEPLTERAIKRAEPERRTRFLWDAKLAGFGVRITPSGVKSYVLRYRPGVPARARLTTIARVGECTLQEARDRAAAIKYEARLEVFDPVRLHRAIRDVRGELDALAERVARLERVSQS